MNDASEMVDVIIPVYNGAASIKQAIESVNNQKNIFLGRIIVVNDGSTDQTASVIRLMNLPNLELITTPNRGVSAARNTGIEAATSEWVAFLDADDTWRSNKLSSQLALAKQKGVSFICTATQLNCKKEEGIISLKSLWKGNFIATSSVLIKKTVAQDLHPLFSPNLTFAEDYAAWFKTLVVGSGYFTSKKLTQYTVGAESHYRLRSIFFNLTILQKECLTFLLGRRIPITKAIAGMAILALGTAISMASILKLFLHNYLSAKNAP